jgi:hypothetical protein
MCVSKAHFTFSKIRAANATSIKEPLLLSLLQQARPSNNEKTCQGEEKMKNLKNEGFKTAETKVRSSKGWRMLFALVLVAAFAVLSAAGPAQVALADKGGVKGHTFNVTFTKWITTFPNMAGVVGGAVGKGKFAGEILKYTPGNSANGNITKIEALYHMNGSRHSFAAHVYVTQNNVTGMAVITGRVMEGWLEGAPVTGEYTVFAKCPMSTPGNVYGTLCFQGTLHVLRGSEQ